ncbi:MAG: hypothetical protein IJK52_00625 [Oscillospiraceae bacterium]|nr:hypothetical protein [Oscillospiraceae bacterium]
MMTVTIRHRLSAALLPLDGFTGQPLGQRVLCELDGVPLARPVWKRDGWLILSDLAPGEHRLALRCPSFQDREISLSGDAKTEIAVTLSPGAGYAFPTDTAFLFLTLSASPEERTQIFAGMPDPRQFKLMREAKAGDSAVKLFLRGAAPRPGWFLLCGKATEAVFFRRVTIDGDAETASPLTQDHARGAALIPAQSFLAAAGENIKIPFRNAGTAHLFCQGHLKTLALQAGEKRNLEWNLEA